MLHAGTKTMQGCDHIIQTKTGHSEVTGRQDAKMMLIFPNTWDSLSHANNINQYYISLSYININLPKSRKFVRKSLMMSYHWLSEVSLYFSAKKLR